MPLAHTVIITVDGRQIKYTPPEPIDMLEIRDRFCGKFRRPIVRMDKDGTAYLDMVPTRDEVESLIAGFAT